MIFAVISGFILAALVPLFSSFARNLIPKIYPFLPLGIFIYLGTCFSQVTQNAPMHWSYNWVPSFGVNLDFRLDGLALLFGMLITGIGTLVFFYSSYYLKEDKYLDRFYGYLSMFMAAMLGLVLSDNLISLFVFWELTSISSFFLIGYKNDDPSSRKSALMALGITGFGGLVLLAGLIWIGFVGGSYSIIELVNSSELIKSHEAYPWIIGLLFIGAFTKSAQFPFHFWLPGAMKAPTPVSTYLHSATMVKAGIYLLARFTPVLGGTDSWNWTLILVGGITMLYAAAHSLFRTDLKSILAYSTISALGILVFLLGVGTEDALLAAGIFILTHALYKATLFLITGIIDHETGTREVTSLGGLQKVMKPVALAGYLAALSSAGVPLFLGFISKEIMYESTFHFSNWAIILTASIVLTKVFLFVAGFWVGIKPFTGNLPQEHAKAKMPSPLLWIPPVFLAGLCVLFGVFPGILDAFMQTVFNSMSPEGEVIHLALWHGLNWVLVLSLLTLGLGFALYKFLKPSQSLKGKLAPFDKFAPIELMERIGITFQSFAGSWTGFFQNGYLRNYVISILIFLTVLAGYRLYDGVDIHLDWSQISDITPSEFLVVVLMVTSIFFALITKTRTGVIVALGIIGLANCLFFLYYSAPDLAMTQFSIDTLTVLLFMLVLFQLPKNRSFSTRKLRVRDGALSLMFGVLISILALEVFEAPSYTEVSEYYAENAYLLAKGKNVVNVILVDFRGIDTLVETVVLVIAAMGVFSLLKLNLNPFNKE
ncbi:Na(+) H(+) antiporter subunit A [Indibacter alkaliphilus LW1]|uniref:Na(+) H(+) antiporter subunit A n=1 Tax=Indibacter alkaliphilus (strain CCUG 57479 / KCTC 22604 / LW1) TaxID=1189612 RepID=S2DHK1_INDAL|nr:hydrogen gas-evolving membrane-bound hydrogenase subunit E [Indibacter alkaliphilus]EOZ98469.1 Na(+) H(+) antiporter subunit A [Indibacter alkaliphilus LW1]